MSRPSTWRWPMALAVLSLVGLVSALVADGLGDALSWLALGSPVAVGAWCAVRRKSRRLGAQASATGASARSARP